MAAPQVGVNIRLMVFNPSGDRKAVHEQMVLVNPEIIEEGGPRRDFEEGCLSFPQMFANVEVRPCPPRCLHCFSACFTVLCGTLIPTHRGQKANYKSGRRKRLQHS